MFYIAASLLSAYVSLFYGQYLAQLNDVLFFQSHRTDFVALISFGQKSNFDCASAPSCYFINLPPETQAWSGQKLISVERTPQGQVLLLALAAKSGLYFTYISATKLSPDNQNKIPFSTNLGYYGVNCYAKLADNWFLCTIAIY